MDAAGTPPNREPKFARFMAHLEPAKASQLAFVSSLPRREIGSGKRAKWGAATADSPTMLYSLAANIALAHYPKTAGSAISEWFRRSFADARYLRPGHPHVNVRRSLAWLSGGRSLPTIDRLRYVARLSNWRLPIEPEASLPTRIRILGVVRDPLDMLASLFGYWRRGETNPDPRNTLVTAAWEGRFEDFVGLAIGGRLPTYEKFFDAGGPAWPNTRLLHFGDVEDGLARACREFGLDIPVLLPRKNCEMRSSIRTAAAIRLSAPLTAAVRRHYTWYHDTFGHADHPASRRRPRSRAAAAA